ncbi:fructosamine kinase family protein [Metabacillus sp. 113a]|uniref:fructosamine kinase family protein n=1 Tax=Metabacillus sp. 113a TaxID=3404706 RepID=UPI003CFA91C8
MGKTANFFNRPPVSGGDINEAWMLQTETRKYFLKTNREESIDFFHAEADGLKEIASSNAIAVPFVLKTGTIDCVPFLLMEWIEGRKTEHTETELGTKLAAMHQTFHTKFGYGSDTYMGKLPQKNGWHGSWVRYYSNERLKPQLELAIGRGHMPVPRRRSMEKLLMNLDRWLGHHPKPSLLHGDLWGGNWMTGESGNPVLIDPSVLYGDHEFEIAFTELFGGFSQAFYSSYQEAFPLSEGYEDRKPLYQLYYLLAHLNMFGESYGRAVDQIISRYA